MRNEYIKLLEQRRELKSIKETMCRLGYSIKNIEFVSTEFNRISEKIRTLCLERKN